MNPKIKLFNQLKLNQIKSFMLKTKRVTILRGPSPRSINFRGALEVYSCEFERGTRNLFQCGSNGQGEDPKKRVFNSKISTNFDCRLTILAIFHEFLSDWKPKKKKGLCPKRFLKSGVNHQKLPPIWEFQASICTPITPSLLISSGHSPRLGGHGPGMPPRGAGTVFASLSLRPIQLHLKNYCSGSESYATLRPIWPTKDLNALPLDQLANRL